MEDFLFILKEFAGIFGFLVRMAGFLLVGFGLGRFLLSAYPRSNWQLQMALALGFFGLLIALTVFSSPGSAGAFALGAGWAFFQSRKADTDATLVEDTARRS